MRKHPGVAAVLLLTSVLAAAPQAAESPVGHLIAALLGSNAMTADLQELTDVIGGRATGSPSNERAIEWAMAVFRAAGVEARREPFEMPARWLERSATATVVRRGFVRSTCGGHAVFGGEPRRPACSAPLVDGGTGSDADLGRLGAHDRGAWVLVPNAGARRHWTTSSPNTPPPAPPSAPAARRACRPRADELTFAPSAVSPQRLARAR